MKANTQNKHKIKDGRTNKQNHKQKQQNMKQKQ